MNIARGSIGLILAVVAQGCLAAGAERVPGPAVPPFAGAVQTTNRPPAEGRLLGFVWVGGGGPLSGRTTTLAQQVAALGGDTAVIDGVTLNRSVSQGYTHVSASGAVTSTGGSLSYHRILYGRAFKVRP